MKLQIWGVKHCLGALLFLALAGCGGGGGSSPPSNPPPPPPPPPNTTEFSIALEALQVVGGSSSPDSGTAELVIDEDSLELTGTVTFEEAGAGSSQTSVQLLVGLAGTADGELLADFVEQQDGSWTLAPPLVLTQQQRELLDAGGIYIEVKSEENPDGALRGQISGDDVEVILVMLSPMQVVPRITSPGTGIGALTFDEASNNLSLHLNTQGLGEQTQSHIHQNLAGTNGGVLIGLEADPENNSHWFIEDRQLSDAEAEALRSGQLYINVHTTDAPAGELRGQIYFGDTEVFFTSLTGGDVIPPVDTTANGLLASTLYRDTMTLNMHLNTSELEDASSAAIRQAPLAQNGPIVMTFDPDMENSSHWQILDYNLAASQYQALQNQGLYAEVYTPEYPAGEVRGQLQPTGAGSTSDTTFRVSATTPANGATVGSALDEVVINFNRDVLAATANQDDFSLTASGGDASFEDGNEMDIAIDSLSVDGDTVTLALAVSNTLDDSYQIKIASDSAEALSDTSGALLDGDADGTPGGAFISTFIFMLESTPSATLADVQSILTTNCATSGCHSGGSPQQGLNLEQGMTYSNTVNVPSVEVPSLLRVEPGNPDDSYLMQKVLGTAAVGGRMPLGGAALSNEDIQVIRSWIQDGAENN